MNILEAFKASNCGKVRRRAWVPEAWTGPNADITVFQALEEDWEPIVEPMTFERIRKECVPGETLLVDDRGSDWLFCGWDVQGDLVAEYLTCSLRGCHPTPVTEDFIKGWRIGGKWEPKALKEQPSDG